VKRCLQHLLHALNKDKPDLLPHVLWNFFQVFLVALGQEDSLDASPMG
jgi:hypothetical protein